MNELVSSGAAGIQVFKNAAGNEAPEFGNCRVFSERDCLARIAGHPRFEPIPNHQRQDPVLGKFAPASEGLKNRPALGQRKTSKSRSEEREHQPGRILTSY